MIFVLWGEDKSCKNTLGFSFPKPLVDMEFDIGGFARANRNLPHLPIKDWSDQGLIKLEQYVMPFQIGDIDAVKNTIQPSKIIVGVKELFYQFATKFIRHLNDKDIQTIMVDTGTLLYETTCLGYLQEKQELQLPLKAGGLGKDDKPLRTQLWPPEYREPYIRMRGFAYQAKAHGKHLVLTHHAADEYGMVKLKDGGMGEGKTGKRVLHGWHQWGDSADVVVHTYLKSEKIPDTNPPQYRSIPYCQVELAEVLELAGMEFREPTYDKIANMIKAMRGEL